MATIHGRGAPAQSHLVARRVVKAARERARGVERDESRGRLRHHAFVGLLLLVLVCLCATLLVNTAVRNPVVGRGRRLLPPLLLPAVRAASVLQVRERERRTRSRFAHGRRSAVGVAAVANTVVARGGFVRICGVVVDAAGREEQLRPHGRPVRGGDAARALDLRGDRDPADKISAPSLKTRTRRQTARAGV